MLAQLPTCLYCPLWDHSLYQIELAAREVRDREAYGLCLNIRRVQEDEVTHYNHQCQY